ncbi:MAG: DUF3343 domain-containing protein [Syntrophaceticus schinkii]|nr:DUF3343 domain-containing protein [Syntrophaceticus schinkii]MDD4262172.1 DUF3343 domain-containing protein [Syntrophaceticus schinkii]
MEETEVYNYYILFPNHHEGLHLHKELKKARVKCSIAPTPRAASSFCGISLLVTEEYLQAAKEVIDNCGVKIEGIAKIRRK